MKLGRPLLPETLKRSERVHVALSKDEYNRICLAALRLRMDVSEFVRRMSIPDSVPFALSGDNLNTK